MLFWLTLHILYIAEVCTAYQSCVGSSLQFDGYTYVVDRATGRRVWTHCAFFSPLVDHALCQRPQANPGEKGYICDPDQLLQTNASSDPLLDERLRQVQSRTATVCRDSEGNRVRIAVAVALIDRVRIPDLHSPKLCINDCGQLLPWRNTSSGWYPDDQEQYAILQNFVDGLRQVWDLGQCHNDVIVLYCKEFNKVTFSVGSGAAEYLTDHHMTQIQQKFMAYLHDDQYHHSLEQALFFLADILQETLKSVRVAVILISTVVSLAFGTFVWFIAYTARYYLEIKFMSKEFFSYPWKVLKWAMKLGSGIWLVQHVMLLMAAVSGRHGKLILLGLVIMFVFTFAFFVIMLTSVTYENREQQRMSNK